MRQRRFRAVGRPDDEAAEGLRGLAERLLNPPVTRRIYRKELRLLDAYARARHAAPGQPAGADAAGGEH